jgi:aldehyde dehydrogenase (NAD+)
VAVIDVRTYDTFYAGGDFIASTSDRHADLLCPHTEEQIGRVPLVSREEVDRVVAEARRAFDEGEWPRLAPAARGEALRRLARLLGEHADELTRIAIDDTGAPYAIASAYCGPMPAFNLQEYADLCDSYEFEEIRESPMGRSLVIREPVGVVVAIPPWNGPLTLGSQKAAPALAAGCSVILKAPVQDPLACYLFAELAHEAGIPPGVLNVIVADIPESEYLVTHPGVDNVSFTGSTGVGKRIGELCGRDIRRATLELGGKSAAIMLEDVDLNVAVPSIIACSVAMHSGEICTAQTRALVPRSRYDEAVGMFAEQIAALPVGDPGDPEMVIGPMITREHRERVEGYIAIGRDEGARLLVGGGRPAQPERGWYVEPTLFVDVDNGMRIAQEEIFGPVLSVIPHDGFDDAVAIANDSPFGLSGTVWTADEDVALDVARRVRTGTFCVNTYTVDPYAPFGGFKQSGIGREMGREGLDAFVELKSVGLSGPAISAA